jgi:hypothetical protein
MEPRIITIDTIADANFARKFITGTVTVAYNQTHLAVAVSQDLVFIIPLTYSDIITDIFADCNVVKLLSKPLPALQSIMQTSCCNCHYILTYVNKDKHLATQLKEDILKASMPESELQSETLSTIMENQTDKYLQTPKQIRTNSRENITPVQPNEPLQPSMRTQINSTENITSRQPNENLTIRRNLIENIPRTQSNKTFPTSEPIHPTATENATQRQANRNFTIIDDEHAALVEPRSQTPTPTSIENITQRQGNKTLSTSQPIWTTPTENITRRQANGNFTIIDEHAALVEPRSQTPTPTSIEKIPLTQSNKTFPTSEPIHPTATENATQRQANRNFTIIDDDYAALVEPRSQTPTPTSTETITQRQGNKTLSTSEPIWKSPSENTPRRQENRNFTIIDEHAALVEPRSQTPTPTSIENITQRQGNKTLLTPESIRTPEDTTRRQINRNVKIIDKDVALVQPRSQPTNSTSIENITQRQGNKTPPEPRRTTPTEDTTRRQANRNFTLIDDDAVASVLPTSQTIKPRNPLTTSAPIRTTLIENSPRTQINKNFSIIDEPEPVLSESLSQTTKTNSTENIPQRQTNKNFPELLFQRDTQNSNNTVPRQMSATTQGLMENIQQTPQTTGENSRKNITPGLHNKDPMMGGGVPEKVLNTNNLTITNGQVLAPQEDIVPSKLRNKIPQRQSINDSTSSTTSQQRQNNQKGITDRNTGNKKIFGNQQPIIRNKALQRQLDDLSAGKSIFGSTKNKPTEVSSIRDPYPKVQSNPSFSTTENLHNEAQQLLVSPRKNGMQRPVDENFIRPKTVVRPRYNNRQEPKGNLISTNDLSEKQPQKMLFMQRGDDNQRQFNQTSTTTNIVPANPPPKTTVRPTLRPNETDRERLINDLSFMPRSNDKQRHGNQNITTNDMSENQQLKKSFIQIDNGSEEAMTQSRKKFLMPMDNISEKQQPNRLPTRDNGLKIPIKENLTATNKVSPTGTSRIQMPRTEIQIPTRGIPTLTTEIQTPTTEIHTPTMGIQTPTRGIQIPTRGIQTPTSEIQIPTSEIQIPTSEIQIPTSEIQIPTSEIQTPTSEIQTPTRGIQTPTRGIQTPARGIQTPARGIQRPARGIQRPASGVQRPISEIQRPTSEIQRPTRGIQMPTSEIQIPTNELQIPTSEIQTIRDGESEKRPATLFRRRENMTKNYDLAEFHDSNPIQIPMNSDIEIIDDIFEIQRSPMNGQANEEIFNLQQPRIPLMMTGYGLQIQPNKNIFGTTGAYEEMNDPQTIINYDSHHHSESLPKFNNNKSKTQINQNMEIINTLASGLERQKDGPERQKDGIKMDWLERERDGLERDRHGLERERDGLKRQKDDLERETNDLERPVYVPETDGLERERNGLERERDGLERERNGLERNGLERERNGLERERNGLERPVYGLERESTGVERPVYGLERERNGLERDGIKRPVYGLERKRDGLERKRHGLERESDGLERDGLERQSNQNITIIDDEAFGYPSTKRSSITSDYGSPKQVNKNVTITNNNLFEDQSLQEELRTNDQQFKYPRTTFKNQQNLITNEKGFETGFISKDDERYFDKTKQTMPRFNRKIQSDDHSTFEIINTGISTKISNFDVPVSPLSSKAKYNINGSKQKLQSKTMLDQPSQVALLMMNYKIATDKLTTEEKSDFPFNENRNAYLAYLTVFNHILTMSGPLSFIDLTNKVKQHPNLLQFKIHPSLALQALITTGALVSDTNTAYVSIPEMSQCVRL